MMKVGKGLYLECLMEYYYDVRLAKNLGKNLALMMGNDLVVKMA
jgi:hypothetical protein